MLVHGIGAREGFSALLTVPLICDRLLLGGEDQIGEAEHVAARCASIAALIPVASG